MHCSTTLVSVGKTRVEGSLLLLEEGGREDTLHSSVSESQTLLTLTQAAKPTTRRTTTDTLSGAAVYGEAARANFKQASH